MEDTDSADAFRVSGRGELHLSILIETMRRQGYELQVSKPEVLFKTIDGVKCEPIERVYIDVPENYVGAVIEKAGRAQGRAGQFNSPFGEHAQAGDTHSLPRPFLGTAAPF